MLIWRSSCSISPFSPCTQGSRSRRSPPGGHPVQTSRHLSQGYGGTQQFSWAISKLPFSPMWTSTLSQRHQSKSKFSKWHPKHIQNWFWTVLTLPSEFYPSFCHKTAGNPLLRKKGIWKNCSPIIVLHLPLFTSLQQFPLWASTKLSHSLLISPLPKGFDWSRIARLGRIVHTTAMQDPSARTDYCHYHRYPR